MDKKIIKEVLLEIVHEMIKLNDTKTFKNWLDGYDRKVSFNKELDKMDIELLYDASPSRPRFAFSKKGNKMAGPEGKFIYYLTDNSELYFLFANVTALYHEGNSTNRERWRAKDGKATATQKTIRDDTFEKIKDDIPVDFIFNKNGENPPNTKRASMIKGDGRPEGGPSSDYHDYTIFYQKYAVNDLDDDKLSEDFFSMTEFYKKYIDKNIDGIIKDELIEYRKGKSSVSIDGDNQGDGSSYVVGNVVEKSIDQYLTEISNGLHGKQIIFNGAPGTGKTFSIRKWMADQCLKFEDLILKDKDTDSTKNVWQFVQFHPSYDYTDFVEGLRPVKLSPENDAPPTFVRMDGVFKEFCREAAIKENNDRKFFFVIDEINRADLGKVFGELMYGLEESYRGEDNALPTQYSNLPTFKKDVVKDETGIDAITYSPIPQEEDAFGDGFYIPENVYIIGTMNDIDRSVDSLDFAMRRRFKWVEITADGVMRSVLEDMFLEAFEDSEEDPNDIKTDHPAVFGEEDSLIRTLTDRMQKMNNTIKDPRYKKLGLSKDYCIGPAYLKDFASYAASVTDTFESDDDFEDLISSVWKNRIRQILVNYCRGRDAGTTEEFIKQCRDAFFTEPDNENPEE